MPDLLPDEEREERVSEALQRLLEAAQGQPMQIREMVEIMRGRGLHMAVVLLCLPFLAPVSIPGISIPFGIAIALCGIRIAFWNKPWLPAMILNRHISYSVLERMVQVGCRVYGKIERVIRPRLLFFVDFHAMRVLTGLAIAWSGILLSLPVPPPIPLTNTIPGFAIIFLALGLIERDGILVLVGYALTLIATLYIGLIALLGKAGAMQIWHWFIG